MKKIITLSLSLLCISFISFAQNQSSQKGPLRGDLNQDNKLDRAEFNKRASQQVKAIDLRMDKTFDRIDKNKDGFLDRNELRQARTKRANNGRKKVAGKGNMRQKASGKKMMQKKRAQAKEKFNRLDRNGNKLLTFREFKRGAKQRPNYSRATAKKVFNRIDANQDGLLEAREFAKAKVNKRGNQKRKKRMRGNRMRR